MSDEEIKKCLECCGCGVTKCVCVECPIRDRESCLDDLPKIALDLINRQQAEIERLQGAVQEWVDGKCLSQKHLLMIGNLQNEIEQAKSEAIKEFADLSIKRICEQVSAPTPSESYIVEKCNETIDNLLAEMVGEQNA